VAEWAAEWVAGRLVDSVVVVLGLRRRHKRQRTLGPLRNATLCVLYLLFEIVGSFWLCTGSIAAARRYGVLGCSSKRSRSARYGRECASCCGVSARRRWWTVSFAQNKGQVRKGKMVRRRAARIMHTPTTPNFFSFPVSIFHFHCLFARFYSFL
jgi:hypothetical protein